LLQERRARRLAGGSLWLADSLPIDACPQARPTFCKRFAGVADYGYCHLRKRTFYGFRSHLRASRDRVILGYQLVPERANEKAVLPELGLPAGSVGAGDRNYWRAARLEARRRPASASWRPAPSAPAARPCPASARHLPRVRSPRGTPPAVRRGVG
jgi:hypothetical protein